MINFFKSLRTKLILFLLGILTFTLIFLGTYLVPVVRENELREASDLNSEVARHLAAVLEITFEQSIAEIEAGAAIIGQDWDTPSLVDQHVREFGQLTQFFNYFFVISTNGQWLSYPNEPQLVGKKVKNDFWVSETLEKPGTHYLDVHVAGRLDKLVTGFVTPIYGTDKSILGLLRGVISLSDQNALFEHLKSIRLGEKGFIYIVDSQGRLITHPELALQPENFKKGNYSKFTPVQKALAGESGITEYLYDDGVWLAAYQPIPATGWAIIVQEPKNEILAKVNDEFRTYNQVLILLVVMTACILILYLQRTLKPLAFLVEAIQKGKSVPAEAFSGDEVGILARKFNAYKEHLEELVSQRTAQLHSTNEELEQEIAERIQTEKVLHEKEAALASIVMAVPVGIGLIQDSKLKWTNDRLVQMLGYDESELIGQDLCFLFDQESEYRRVCSSAENVAQFAEQRVETIWKRKDETSFDVQLGFTAINPGAPEEGLIFSAIDISDKKKREAEQQRTQKLESLGVLAGGIAHDFNNLLQAMLAHISMGRRLNALNEPIEENLIAIEKAIERSTQLTNQLLTFSKGGAPVRLLVQLQGIIKDAVSFALRGSNCACKFEVADDLWSVKADSGQLSQVFQNLAINAIQAMPHGGSLTVRAEDVMLEANQIPPLVKGNYVKIDFVDRGSGISQENLAKIFDPYFTTKEKGTGLGLAVAYSIIKNHGGLLIAESLVGQGTTLSIFIPANDVDAADEAKDKTIIQQGSGRILFLDDEPSLQEAAILLFELIGYDCVAVSDGTEVIEHYQKARKEGHPFDVVVVDLTIPGGMGGKEAIAKLRALDPTLKAIVSSGYAHDPIMADYQNYGFDGVIVKPYTIEAISAVLQKVLDR